MFQIKIVGPLKMEGDNGNFGDPPQPSSLTLSGNVLREFSEWVVKKTEDLCIEMMHNYIDVDMYMSISSLVPKDGSDNKIKVTWKTEELKLGDKICLTSRFPVGEGTILAAIALENSEGTVELEVEYEAYTSTVEATKYFMLYARDHQIGKVSKYDNMGLLHSQLGPRFGHFSLSQLFTLGAHNAGAIISLTSEISLLDQYAFNTYICQNVSVYQQLMQGVRYLDMRICRNLIFDSGTYEVRHLFFCVYLNQVLSDIQRFYRQPQTHREVLVIDFHSVSQVFTDGHAKDFYALIEEKIGYLMLGYTEGMPLPTLQEFWDRGANVIVATTSEILQQNKATYSVDHLWANEIDVDKIEKFVANQYEIWHAEGHPTNIVATMFEVTRNPAIHPFLGLRQYSEVTNAAVNNLMKNNSLWKAQTNVLALDFIRGFDQRLLLSVNEYKLANAI